MTLGTEARQGADDPFAHWPGRRALIAGLALLLVVVVAGPKLFPSNAATGLTQLFWQRQDAPVMPLLLLLVATLPLLLRQTPQSRRFAPRLSPWMIWSVAAVTCLAAWSAHDWLMRGYELSRDEQMVLFDADILAHGQWFARLPAEWAAVGAALNRMFILPGIAPDTWVSGYLPINALLHCAGSMLGDTHATAPLLAAIAVVALWASARQLWPDDRAPQCVALLCLVLSAQFLVTAATPYAMTAHLAFNLVWLALFLRDRWWSYALLLPIGFLATGLHQPVFHPLFVAPFLWLLAERRQWRVLAWLVAGYAAIGLFWLNWPAMVIGAAGGAAGPATAGGAGYLARLTDMLAGWSPGGIWVMALNLLRFAAWQHLLLLPLVAAAVASQWRQNAMIRALAAGVVLTVAAMLVLLPYQGHGWGYRYLHGLIGNLCLLAGFGWLALRERGWDRRRLILLSSAASFGALLWLGWNAHRMVAPYAEVNRQIAASDADYVLIDDQAAPFLIDLVYNQPFLDHHPIRLAASRVAPHPAWKRLCAGRTLAVVDAAMTAPIRRVFGIAEATTPPDATAAAALLYAAGCKKPDQDRAASSPAIVRAIADQS